MVTITVVPTGHGPTPEAASVAGVGIAEAAVSVVGEGEGQKGGLDTIKENLAVSFNLEGERTLNF